MRQTSLGGVRQECKNCFTGNLEEIECNLFQYARKDNQKAFDSLYPFWDCI